MLWYVAGEPKNEHGDLKNEHLNNLFISMSHYLDEKDKLSFGEK